ncbi:tail fiber protein of prophage CP-933T [Escherichia coli]|nr:tail fiber protein of prophage CP-933T [Escherichia coli]
MRRKKRIGPGDIVFKNLPRALAVRGEWQERKIAQVSKPAPAITITPVVPAPLPPALVLLLRPAPARWRRLYDRQWHQFLQIPVTGSLLPPDLAVKFMFICITLLHRIPANWRNWSVKWSGQKWNGAPVPDVAVFTIKIEESWP